MRFLIVSLGLCPLGCSVVQSNESKLIRVVSWNVENLFDCEDDPLTSDDDFLPSAPRRWTENRLSDKLAMISKTLVAFPDNHLPDLVALQEVEDDSVLTQLTRRSPLRAIGYEYIMTHSPDRRGINVALLYRPEIFKVLSQESLRFDRRPTRDILSVTGRLNTGDTLCILVCHLPSKLQGRAGDRFRWSICDSIKRYVSARLAQEPDLKILVMGDMNSLPSDLMWTRGLGDGGSGVLSMPLRNLTSFWKPSDGVKGSYKYNGQWQLLDQCWASTNWDERWDLEWDVVRFSFLLTTDEWGQPQPRRTYNGYRYAAGVSDHLPTCLDCRLR